MIKPFDEMKPYQIIKAKDASGLALIPVGPLEWHGPHLPYGTDAIIAEAISKIIAGIIRGVFFKALNYGLDSYRTKRQLSMWGFKKDDRIFGMNFPKLPLVSEYCTESDLGKNISRRLQFLKDCRFNTTLVINHHGGKGQIPLIKKICEDFSESDFIAESIYSMDYCTIDNQLPKYVGTHAGIWETQLVMAFRPDLVDLSLIPGGKIKISQLGIAHNKPEIDEKYDPRNADIKAGNKVKENIIENLLGYIKNKYIN